MKLFSLLIFFLLAFNCKSQSNRLSTSDQSMPIDNFVFPDIDNFTGTYQFVVKEKKNFLLTTETFEFIEANRKDTDDITIALSAYLDVYIPSKQKISQSNFQFFSTTFILK